MRFSIPIILGLHFLLCQRVSSSQLSFLQKQILSIEKAADSGLGKFFTGLSKVYLQKRDPRQVMIVGASDDQLRKADALIESYPYSICTKPEKCFYPKDFNSGSFLIVFLDDLGEKTLEKNLKILSGDISDCEFLFIFDGVVINIDEITSFLSRGIVRHGVVQGSIAHLFDDKIKVYRPYMGDDCTVRAELIWESETDFDEINLLSLEKLDFKRCPIPVGSFQYTPKMIIEEKGNGSPAIVGGRDGKLVLLIAEKLNFTVNLKYPSKSDARDYSQKSTLIKEVNSGIIDFGVGRIRPTNESAISMPFDRECITWAVPRINTTRDLLWLEFPWEAWALIGSVLIISCAIGYAHGRIISSGNANNRIVKIGDIILNVVSMNLGNAATHLPVSIAGKVMIIAFLYYALVMTTAYKASLDSILTTVKSRSTITDPRGIVEANIEVGGSVYHYEVLKDQSDDSEITSELIKRYIVYSNDSEAAQRVKCDPNFAFLARQSTLYFEKQMTVKDNDLLEFNILDECVLTYPTVLVFPKGSPFLMPINQLIMRIRASGILEYWDRLSYVSDKELESENAQRFSVADKRQKFAKIFIFYFGCIFVCLIVFLVEILVARFRPKNRQGIARRNRQSK